MEESLLKKEADKKHNSWALYRECTRPMEENHTIWLERRTAEEKRRLEDEKASRIGGRKKKETKPEAARRLEDKRTLEGKLKMKTELWRQRREKDGKLVMVWRNMKEETEPENTIDNLGPEKGQDYWMEEIVLTVIERKALQELEKCASVIATSQ